MHQIKLPWPLFLKEIYGSGQSSCSKSHQKDARPSRSQDWEETWSEAAPNALLELTWKEALEERPTGPEIIVVPQAVQEPPGVRKIFWKFPFAERMELADQIVVQRQIPVEDPEEEMGSIDSNPVLTTIDETGPEDGDILRDANSSRKRQQSTN